MTFILHEDLRVVGRLLLSRDEMWADVERTPSPTIADLFYIHTCVTVQWVVLVNADVGQLLGNGDVLWGKLLVTRVTRVHHFVADVSDVYIVVLWAHHADEGLGTSLEDYCTWGGGGGGGGGQG